MMRTDLTQFGAEVQDFMTEDMNPLKRRDKESSSTFLGFCKPPGHPHTCRLDIKIYPRRYIALPPLLPFLGSQAQFSRLQQPKRSL